MTNDGTYEINEDGVVFSHGKCCIMSENICFFEPKKQIFTFCILKYEIDPLKPELKNIYFGIKDKKFIDININYYKLLSFIQTTTNNPYIPIDGLAVFVRIIVDRFNASIYVNDVLQENNYKLSLRDGSFFIQVDAKSMIIATSLTDKVSSYYPFFKPEIVGYPLHIKNYYVYQNTSKDDFEEEEEELRLPKNTISIKTPLPDIYASSDKIKYFEVVQRHPSPVQDSTSLFPLIYLSDKPICRNQIVTININEKSILFADKVIGRLSFDDIYHGCTIGVGMNNTHIFVTFNGVITNKFTNRLNLNYIGFNLLNLSSEIFVNYGQQPFRYYDAIPPKGWCTWVPPNPIISHHGPTDWLYHCKGYTNQSIVLKERCKNFYVIPDKKHSLMVGYCYFKQNGAISSITPDNGYINTDLIRVYIEDGSINLRCSKSSSRSTAFPNHVLFPVAVIDRPMAYHIVKEYDAANIFEDAVQSDPNFDLKAGDYVRSRDGVFSGKFLGFYKGELYFSQSCYKNQHCDSGTNFEVKFVMFEYNDPLSVHFHLQVVSRVESLEKLWWPVLLDCEAIPYEVSNIVGYGAIIRHKFGQFLGTTKENNYIYRTLSSFLTNDPCIVSSEKPVNFKVVVTAGLNSPVMLKVVSGCDKFQLFQPQDDALKYDHQFWQSQHIAADPGLSPQSCNFISSSGTQGLMYEIPDTLYYGYANRYPGLLSSHERIFTMGLMEYYEDISNNNDENDSYISENSYDADDECDDKSSNGPNSPRLSTTDESTFVAEANVQQQNIHDENPEGGYIELLAELISNRMRFNTFRVSLLGEIFSSRFDMSQLTSSSDVFGHVCTTKKDSEKIVDVLKLVYTNYVYLSDDEIPQSELEDLSSDFSD